MTGTITPWMCVDAAYPQVYTADDPRAWRNECQGETLPIRDFFERVKKELETLRFIPCFKADHDIRPRILFPEESPERAEVS